MTINLPRFKERSLCAEVDVGDLFFPEKGGTSAPAKRICNGDDRREPCPAKDECLAWAMAHQEAGVWGGTSEWERRSLRAYQAGLPRQCGSTYGYKQHLKRKEAPCGPCREANAEYGRDYRHRRRRAS